MQNEHIMLSHEYNKLSLSKKLMKAIKQFLILLINPRRVKIMSNRLITTSCFY